jgi:hypothetical protein
MRYSDLDDFLKRGSAVLAKGPIALIFVEDFVEVDATIRHHRKLNFSEIILFAPEALALPKELADEVHRVGHTISEPNSVMQAVNRISQAAPDTWFYYCYNAEFLFYPFCETRTVGEMLSFHTEERRDAMLTYVVDLYATDLQAAPNAVNLDAAYLDRSGYYALARHNEVGHPKERQLDFFGGLRWRFEEHIAYDRRKIDRIAIFRAQAGLELREDHTFSDEEYNTFSCPWHHNVTAAICSFRTAKALKLNAGSKDMISTFEWHNSTAFQWQSQQLLELGLMEPGQWF